VNEEQCGSNVVAKRVLLLLFYCYVLASVSSLFLVSIQQCTMYPNDKKKKKNYVFKQHYNFEYDDPISMFSSFEAHALIYQSNDMTLSRRSNNFEK